MINDINEQWLADIQVNLGIKVKRHNSFPLAILNYDQINSPKCNETVMKCRGLILDTETWEVVCHPMQRFFNEGEALEITEKFNWDNFDSYTKEDGSLIHLWNYKGEWNVSTRGSFADGICGESGKTWKELIEPLLPETSILDPSNTYAFEFCSYYNKVIRAYKDPFVTLLAIINTKSGVEYSQAQIDEFASNNGINRPDKFHHDSIEEVMKSLDHFGKHDQTFEGFVLTDVNGMRLKVKSKTYVALHHLRGSGENMFLIRNLVPFLLSGETDEVLAYFPEIAERLAEVQENFNELEYILDNTWMLTHGIENQKEFALAVKDCPLNWVLFQERKTGKLITEILAENPSKVARYLESLDR